MSDHLNEIERFRPYLLCIARSLMTSGGDLVVDAEDAAHQTILKAHEKRQQFQGSSEGELAAWLRAILRNHIRDVYRRAGRSFDEQSLAHQLEQSSARLENLLVAKDATPSKQARHRESIAQLAIAITQLPDDQRQAVELRYLYERSLDEIATAMQRSRASIAGLLQRGLRELRTTLADDV